jgi:hypothetical protein
MLKIARDGLVPDVDGSIGPLAQYEELKKKGTYEYMYVSINIYILIKQLYVYAYIDVYYMNIYYIK